MATPRLPPECVDCEQRPRVGRSTRCEQCRMEHRRDRQTGSQRERRQRSRTESIPTPEASGERAREPYLRLDPEVQQRVLAVEHALRYSVPYAKHLHQRIGPTPYLDDLHAAISDLLRQLSAHK